MVCGLYHHKTVKDGNKINGKITVSWPNSSCHSSQGTYIITTSEGFSRVLFHSGSRKVAPECIIFFIQRGVHFPLLFISGALFYFSFHDP